MSDEDVISETAGPFDAPDADQGDQRGLLRLETRLARAEAQIRTLQEGVADLNAFHHAAKQRSLYLRIGILAALLAAFFYLQYSK